MTDQAATFIWYELLTTDIAAAKAFYDAVVGWSIQPCAQAAAGGMDYRMIERSNGEFAGGAMELTADMLAGGAATGWLGYIHVPDVDAEVEAVVAGGGTVAMPAITMDGVGRMAMVLDPQRNAYYVMAPQPPAGNPDAKSTAFTVDQPQSVRWNELVTPDDEAAVAWYTGHYHWTQEGAFPMGELGPYRFIQADGVGIGAIMKKAEFMPKGGWAFYFGVTDIDSAASAVQAGGGQIVSGPQEIPGGEFTIQALDPQGGHFGLVGPRQG